MQGIHIVKCVNCFIMNFQEGQYYNTRQSWDAVNDSKEQDVWSTTKKVRNSLGKSQQMKLLSWHLSMLILKLVLEKCSGLLAWTSLLYGVISRRIITLVRNLARDCGKSMAFASAALEIYKEDPTFLQNIVLTDEASFTSYHILNKQNVRIWSQENPREVYPAHTQ